MRTTFLSATLAVLVSAGSASAQQAAATAAGDARWQPWIGCWQLQGESVGDDSDVSAEEIAGGKARTRQSRATSGTRMCVAPGGTPGAVTLTTIVGTEKALEETVAADAVNHPFTDEECRGTKRSEWSKTGRRLFTRAEITCADQTARKVSSITMMTLGPTWVDIQLIEIGGRKNIRVRRYEPVDPSPSVAFAGETSWTLDDVKEASAKLTPETVQAALVEFKKGFDLSGKKLVELDEAGVPDSVIDLMVALSYPKRFVVEHPVSAPSYYGGGAYGGFGGLSGTWPWIADAYFWPSYYSPFAYRYWGYYDPYYVPSSGYVYVGPGYVGPGGAVTPPTAVGSGQGRVVDGFGYTRIRERAAEPIQANGFGGGNNSGMSSGSGGSSGSSGNSGVSSGGYSSGGGGDGGRTAVPRPPGGN